MLDASTRMRPATRGLPAAAWSFGTRSVARVVDPALRASSFSAALITPEALSVCCSPPANRPPIKAAGVIAGGVRLGTQRRHSACAHVAQVVVPCVKVLKEMSAGIVKFLRMIAAPLILVHLATECTGRLCFHAAAAAVISSQTAKRLIVPVRHWGALIR